MNLSGTQFSNLDKSCEETQTLELSLSQNTFVDLKKLFTEMKLKANNPGMWGFCIGMVRNRNSVTADATESIHEVTRVLKWPSQEINLK